MKFTWTNCPKSIVFRLPVLRQPWEYDFFRKTLLPAQLVEFDKNVRVLWLQPQLLYRPNEPIRLDLEALLSASAWNRTMHELEEIYFCSPEEPTKITVIVYMYYVISFSLVIDRTLLSFLAACWYIYSKNWSLTKPGEAIRTHLTTSKLMWRRIACKTAS